MTLPEHILITFLKLSQHSLDASLTHVISRTLRTLSRRFVDTFSLLKTISKASQQFLQIFFNTFSSYSPHIPTIFPTLFEHLSHSFPTVYPWNFYDTSPTLTWNYLRLSLFSKLSYHLFNTFSNTFSTLSWAISQLSQPFIRAFLTLSQHILITFNSHSLLPRSLVISCLLVK